MTTTPPFVRQVELANRIAPRIAALAPAAADARDLVAEAKDLL